MFSSPYSLTLTFSVSAVIQNRSVDKCADKASPACKAPFSRADAFVQKPVFIIYYKVNPFIVIQIVSP